MTDEQMSERNAQLEAMSTELFGDTMKFQIVRPTELVLLKENARFFKRETFRQLCDNIAADRKLSSVPLCYRYEDGRLEVLSGNHRVQAAIEAALPEIMVMVITEELAKSKRIAIQLSHNSLVGLDDNGILSNLWAQIDDLSAQMYSGLDSESVGAIQEVDMLDFKTPNPPTKLVTFFFTESELEKLETVMSELEMQAKKSSRVWIAPMEQYARFTEALVQAKGAQGVRDGSIAIANLLPIVERWLEEQKNGAKEARA